MTTKLDVIALAREAGASSFTPPPMRAVRGVSMTFEQIEAFAALVVGECISIAENGFNRALDGSEIADALRSLIGKEEG